MCSPWIAGERKPGIRCIQSLDARSNPYPKERRVQGCRKRREHLRRAESLREMPQRRDLHRQKTARHRRVVFLSASALTVLIYSIRHRSDPSYPTKRSSARGRDPGSRPLCLYATIRSFMTTHETRFRVRYAETDQMGVVYYSNYFIWMELGRAEYCRASGFRYKDMEAGDGILLAVVDAHCRYVFPARYDDEIAVVTSIATANRRMV